MSRGDIAAFDLADYMRQSLFGSEGFTPRSRPWDKPAEPKKKRTRAEARKILRPHKSRTQEG